MPSRRATVRAGSAAVATALSGCLGSLFGGSDGGGTDPKVTLEAFAADHALTDVFDVGAGDVEYANASVSYWDLDALDPTPDAKALLNGDRFPTILRIQDDRRDRWNQQLSTVVTTVHRLGTSSTTRDVSGLAADGPFEADQYREAAALDSASGDHSAGSFDLYLSGPSPAVGVADGAVALSAGESDTGDVGEQDSETATPLQVRHLEEYVDRLTNRPDPSAWKLDALDRVSGTPHLSVDLGAIVPGDAPPAIICDGASPSGDGQYVYRYAIAAPTEADFRDWWDADVIRESLARLGTSEPTIDTGDRSGHAEVTVGAEALIDLVS